MPVLIGARALAGLGAALLLPASLAIIRVLWPDPVARGKVLGLWAGCNGLALAMGPTLGGLLMHALGWRSIFYVVIPFGGALALIAASALPESSEAGGRRFDVVGQVFGAAALAGAAVAAIQSHHAPIVAVVAAVGAVVALAVFFANERRLGDGAMMPLGLFRAPAFTGAMAATASMTFGMYGVLFLLPLAWQQAEMFGPVGAGVALMPMALAFVLVSPLSGALTARVGTPVMASGGVAIAAAGLVVVAVAAARASMPATMVALAMTGVGTGLATGPLLGAAIAAVPAPRAGTAAALINVARMVGATGGVAVLGAIFALDADTFAGLQHALLVGAGLQLAGAAVASLTTGRQPRPRGKPNATS
ncbi:MFS transporter [Arhodomonas sp. AD133]|uniref:MFS transporter n=1 Tax=Arhodomonas sp. AD133 TaxID=3415009 RepID=UPI003EB8CCC7